MTDIVWSLRNDVPCNGDIGCSYELCNQAADEITRLRAEVEKLRALVVKADEAIERQQQDLEEAADRAADCDILRALNEKLRTALEEIASGKYSGIVLTSYPPQDPAVNRARAAITLEEKQ